MAVEPILLRIATTVATVGGKALVAGRRLAPIAEAELAAMPTAERDLVLEGVGDTLEATDFTDEVLFETNLDEAALVRLTRPARLRELTVVNTSDVPDLDTLQSLPSIR